MNIIALLESISLDKSRIGSFSWEDFALIERQLIEQKGINPEISDSDIEQLLQALKHHSDSLKVVVNNRVLYNFLAKKDYARRDFTFQEVVDTEKVKMFVKQFFGEELNSFLIPNLEQNKFAEISQLAETKDYFPDDLLYILKQHSLDKLDEAIEAIKPPHGNLSNILFIKNSHFFAFLGNIKDHIIETKVKDLFDAVSAFHRLDPNSELANKTFTAMISYDAIDSEFSQKIRRHKEVAAIKYDAHIPKKRNLTWVFIVVGLFVVGRLAFFIYIQSLNSPTYNDTYDEPTYDDTEYTQEPRKIDRYYTNMKYSIDSFNVFLTSYKDSEIKQLKQNVSLKTGENPFETFYQNAPTADSNHFITVTNKTGYDMVLLENTVLYDSIKMPVSAHFIKAGDNLEINFNSDYTGTIFNMYLGKKWATFQTVTNKNLFIRNHSVVEYRFSQLVPAAKEILTTDYNLINDAVITYSKGNLKVDSNGARINPLKGNGD